jgi:excisionase family DNA binding protein
VQAAEGALLLTIDQAAALLSVSTRTVENLIRLGQLDSVRVGRCRRVTRVAVVAYVDRLVAEQIGP